MVPSSSKRIAGCWESDEDICLEKFCKEKKFKIVYPDKFFTLATKTKARPYQSLAFFAEFQYNFYTTFSFCVLAAAGPVACSELASVPFLRLPPRRVFFVASLASPLPLPYISLKSTNSIIAI